MAGLPGVRAKGVQRVVLLRKRAQAQRLDVWPFLAGYLMLAIKIIFHGSQFQW